jgi:hypothetical protein
MMSPNDWKSGDVGLFKGCIRIVVAVLVLWWLYSYCGGCISIVVAVLVLWWLY